jgi:hypothetical protein
VEVSASNIKGSDCKSRDDERRRDKIILLTFKEAAKLHGSVIHVDGSSNFLCPFDVVSDKGKN